MLSTKDKQDLNNILQITTMRASELVKSCHFTFFLSSWAIKLPGLCNGQYAVRLFGIKYKTKHVAFKIFSDLLQRVVLHYAISHWCDRQVKQDSSC